MADEIDREWIEPVYKQIAARVRDQIRSGELEPGRPVPSVRTLTEEYGVARDTASAALRLLAEEGLTRRVPGRGWFVASPPSSGDSIPGGNQ